MKRELRVEPATLSRFQVLEGQGNTQRILAITDKETAHMFAAAPGYRHAARLAQAELKTMAQMFPNNTLINAALEATNEAIANDKKGEA